MTLPWRIWREKEDRGVLDRHSVSWRFIAVLVVLIAAMVVRGELMTDRSTAKAGSIDLMSPFLTTNRTMLGICVQTSPDVALPQEAARKRIDAAFASVRAAESWPESLKRERFAVVAGCPTAAALTDPSSPMQPSSKGGADSASITVTTPSAYLVHVVILSDAHVRALFGAVGLRVQAQERLCDENQHCAQVTTGLYLSERELDDPGFVAGWLSKAIGVVAPVTPSNADPDQERTKFTPVATSVP